MQALNASACYRPVRIGWCVAAGDMEALRRALSSTHTLWGGRYNPVIPVSGADAAHARSLIAAFEIDYLVPLSSDSHVAALLKEFHHLAWTGMFGDSSSLFFKIGGQKISAFLDVAHAVRLLAERQEKRPDRIRPAAVSWTARDNDPLADVVAIMYGHYPDPTNAGRDYYRLIKDDLGASNSSLEPASPFPAPRPGTMTPNSLTGVDLKPDRTLWTRVRSGFYVGSAARFDDLVFFWNLRAANIDLAFYDPAHSDRLDGIRRNVLAGWRDIETDEKPVVNVWHSAAPGSPVTLEGLDEGAKSFVATASVWSSGELRPPQMRWKPFPLTGILHEGRSGPSVTAQLQRKPFDEEAAGRERVAVSVTFIPNLGEGEFTYRLPNIPSLAPLLPPEWEHEQLLRLGQRGPTYLTHASSEAVHIRGWDAATMVRAVFEAAGMVATPSSAGKRATRLIKQLGGLWECEILKIAGVRLLLKDYLASQDFGCKEALRQIGAADFEAYAELATISHRASALQAQDVFDHLIERGVFRVGLRIECDHCGLSFWISLDEARTRTDCEYCGNSVHLARQLGGVHPWRYRRSGLFSADDDQQGAVPVALTLRQLYMASRVDEYLWLGYTTGMEMEGPDVGIRKCESDLVVVTQTRSGTVNVLIGECKTGSRIKPEVVEQLGAVASALNAIGVKAYIVFSKLTEFTSDEIDVIKRLDQAADPRVIMFTARDLEPAYPYEHAENEHGFYVANLEFAGLAAATRAIFLLPEAPKN